MKNTPEKKQRLCSDFDDRPIFDPDDNLYNSNGYDSTFYNAKSVKKLKTERNSEKYEENDLIHPEI